MERFTTESDRYGPAFLSSNPSRQHCLYAPAASVRQKVDVRRISFIDALRWLQSARPGDELEKLILKPPRPNRLEPRVRKRRPKQYPLMKKGRKELKKALCQQ